MEPIRWKGGCFRACCVAAWLGGVCLALSSFRTFAAPEIAPGELIVRFRNGASPAELDHAHRAAKLKVKRHLRTAAMAQHGHPGLTIVMSDLEPARALAILRKDPAVEYAEPNYVVRTMASSNDPYFTTGNLWGMYGDVSTPANGYGSQAAEAWAAGYVGSSSVYVAVIDDGMQITHPELAGNLWTNPFDPPDGVDNDGNGYADDVNGWNFAGTNNVVYKSGDVHGTHVAGIIGAKGGNGLGVAGVNWNVTLIPLKFISGGTGTTDHAVEAIDYCVDLKGRHAINLVAINASWGGAGYSEALHEAILRAAKAGILFVAAAQNSGLNNDISAAMPANLDSTFGTLFETPASYNNVITVAAIDSSGGLASFSNYGAARVHIGAPGVGIYSTYPPNAIASLDGTSMAAPHVTGAVALYASTHPTATPGQIRAAILGAALPTASLLGKVSTGGRLNLSDIIAPVPSLAAAGAVLVSETLTNGVVDPGETVTVQLTITNTTPWATTSLVGTLQASGGVVNSSGSQSFGALLGGANAVARDFTFTADGTCGESITLTLALQDGAVNRGTVTFALPLGRATNVFVENFDAVTTPALPAGWTVSHTGLGNTWQTVAGFSSSGANAVYAPNTDGVSENWLTSPVIHIQSGSARLSFQHSFNFEPDWDGGLLEISIGGGGFAEILAAGGTFVQGGYTLLLNSDTTPLTSRLVWSGDSGGFISTTVQLPSACFNQDVQLRWHAGSDTSFGGAGWFVDSISITDGYVCSLPDVSIAEDHSAGPISVGIGNANGQSGLQLSGNLSNAALVPSENFAFSGTGTTRSVSFTPATNEFGSGTVTLKVESALATSYRTFNLIVSPVNDPPTFTAGANIVSAQDSGAQSFTGWATGISAGPANEAAQQLTFSLAPDQASLFASGPVLGADGTLSYTPASHRRGVANVSVQLHDDGGTANSGMDASAVGSFTISIGQTTDTDGDGIPDDFETAFNLNPNSAADATMDADGDGFTNLQEFQAGTDPLDPRSSLRILGPENGGLASGVQFSSVLGRAYSVEQNSNFPAGAWQGVGTGNSGTGSLVSQSDSGSNLSDLRRLYRVKTAGELGGSVMSEYAGYCRLTLLGNSDTFVSMPFSRPPAEFGAVLSVGGNVVQLRGSPGWTANRWVYNAPSQTNTYYLLVRSGPLEGDYFTITANSSDTLTLDLEGGSLAQLALGDAVAIVPFWTLGTVFPMGQGVNPSASPANRATEVLFPNLTGNGVNLSATATYYRWTGAWRKVGAGAAVKSDDVILPDMYLVVRHNVSGDTTLTTEGSMLAVKSHIPIRRDLNKTQDNDLALARPLPVALNASSLVEDGIVRASSSPSSRLDELLVFDNSVAARNKSAAGDYYFWNGIWSKIGANGADQGSDVVFTPGTGVILRSGAGSDATWEIPSPY
jgi:uncharacterized protein (TIGR02597 family)